MKLVKVLDGVKEHLTRVYVDAEARLAEEDTDPMGENYWMGISDTAFETLNRIKFLEAEWE